MFSVSGFNVTGDNKSNFVLVFCAAVSVLNNLAFRASLHFRYGVRPCTLLNRNTVHCETRNTDCMKITQRQLWRGSAEIYFRNTIIFSHYRSQWNNVLNFKICTEAYSELEVCYFLLEFHGLEDQDFVSLRISIGPLLIKKKKTRLPLPPDQAYLRTSSPAFVRDPHKRVVYE